MKTIKIKSGGEAYSLEPGETCPPGAICFFPGEWELALRMGKAAATDPDNTFWKDLLENKRAIPGYTLFCDAVVAKPKEEQAPLDFKALGIRPRGLTEKEAQREKCLGIAREILQDLKARVERQK